MSCKTCIHTFLHALRLHAFTSVYMKKQVLHAHLLDPSILKHQNEVGIEKIPALKFEIGIVSFKPIFFIHAVVLLQIEN